MHNLKLIVRLPNWVGDVMMALPALQAMQTMGIELSLFGKSWATHLLAGTGLPVFPIEKHWWQTSKKMRFLRDTDKVLLLTNSFSSALTARFASKKVIGYRADARGLLLTASLDKSPALHEVEYFWEIARFAVNHWFPHLVWPKEVPNKINLPLPSSALARADQLLEKANITQPFWVLCPFAHGTGENGESKIWRHWQALSWQLNDRPLVVCPAKQEEDLCAQLVPNAIILPGLNLEEYAAIMAKSEYVIANDSGPLHMATAVNDKNLGIFTTTSPERTRPWGGNYIGSQAQYPSLQEVLDCLEVK